MFGYKNIQGFIGSFSDRFDNDIGKVGPDKKLDGILSNCLNNLKNNEIVKQNGTLLRGSEYSQIMAKFYLKFETCKNFINIKPNISEHEFFDLFCSSQEFSQIRFRKDKQILNQLGTDLKYAVKKRVDERFEKVSVLIQVNIVDLDIVERNSNPR